MNVIHLEKNNDNHTTIELRNSSNRQIKRTSSEFFRYRKMTNDNDLFVVSLSIYFSMIVNNFKKARSKIRSGR